MGNSVKITLHLDDKQRSDLMDFFEINYKTAKAKVGALEKELNQARNDEQKYYESYQELSGGKPVVYNKPVKEEPQFEIKPPMEIPDTNYEIPQSPSYRGFGKPVPEIAEPQVPTEVKKKKVFKEGGIISQYLEILTKANKPVSLQTLAYEAISFPQYANRDLEYLRERVGIDMFSAKKGGAIVSLVRMGEKSGKTGGLYAITEWATPENLEKAGLYIKGSNEKHEEESAIEEKIVPKGEFNKVLKAMVNTPKYTPTTGSIAALLLDALRKSPTYLSREELGPIMAKFPINKKKSLDSIIKHVGVDMSYLISRDLAVSMVTKGGKGYRGTFYQTKEWAIPANLEKHNLMIKGEPIVEHVEPQKVQARHETPVALTKADLKGIKETSDTAFVYSIITKNITPLTPSQIATQMQAMFRYKDRAITSLTETVPRYLAPAIKKKLAVQLMSLKAGQQNWIYYQAKSWCTETNLVKYEMAIQKARKTVPKKLPSYVGKR